MLHFSTLAKLFLRATWALPIMESFMYLWIWCAVDLRCMVSVYYVMGLPILYKFDISSNLDPEVEPEPGECLTGE